jgi:YidC/Oxa1 family membrane protein insertase
MMRLYREHGTNPLSSCFPVLAQAPFLFILYSVIHGLSALDPLKQAAPKYIPHTSNMYRDLVLSKGQINVFGMDMSLKPFDHHSSFYAAIPFFAMLFIAVGLQYFQMAQINNRNKKAGNAMPAQQQMIQRFMPILFVYFYVIIPAAVVLYMVVSTLIRIITQDIMFRIGVSDPSKAKERQIPSREASPAKSEKTEVKEETLKSQANRSKSKKQRKAR